VLNTKIITKYFWNCRYFVIIFVLSTVSILLNNYWYTMHFP